MPVAGPKIAASDLPVGRALNGNAVLRRWQPVGVAVLPLPDLGVTLHADGDAKLRDGEGPIGSEVVVEGHAPIVIANAIAPQVAQAIEAFATVRSMVSATEQERRLARFIDLLKQFGDNKAELGRALGYKSGAYVRQLKDRERPITETVIENVHSMLGGKYRGWFDARVHSAPEALPAPLPWPFRRLTPSDWDSFDVYERAAMEEAALEKLRELRAGVSRIPPASTAKAAPDLKVLMRAIQGLIEAVRAQAQGTAGSKTGADQAVDREIRNVVAAAGAQWPSAQPSPQERPVETPTP